MAKGIVYIDIDDEITHVIEKVESSTEKVLALVLPKHATTFLSTVNMKLLKRAADTAKKSIVLITSDEGILPLAGAAKLHVAKSLQSKPAIPASPQSSEETALTMDADTDADEPEGAVAATVHTAAKKPADTVIQLDNTEKKLTKEVVLGPKNKKLKIPNFHSFRLRLALGVLLLVAGSVGLFMALVVMPKAKITLKTDVTPVEVSLPFTASVSTKELNIEKGLLPATQTSRTENDTEKVAATGKKDAGTKATGLITVTNCTDNDVTLPAGTVFANSGHSYTTDTDIQVPASDFFSNGNCKNNRHADVAVTAVQAGDGSNLSAGRSYTSSFADTITGIGGAMGGGTSRIVTVVSNEDVESAKQKLSGRQKSAANDDVVQQLKDANLVPLNDTFKEGAPVFTTDVAVGAEAQSVTVKAVTVYTMLGVTKEDMIKLIEASVNKQITDTRQKIQNNGFDKRQLQLGDSSNINEQKLTLKTTAIIGPDIDIAGIAQESAGQKRGDIQERLAQRAGVKDVTVSYSPFWVLQTPKKASKITVVVEQVNASK